MAVRTSTGFCAAILGPASFDSIFRDGVIEIYSGPQPDSADLPPTGDLLGRITNNGMTWAAGQPAGGLRFIRDGRYAAKDPGQAWQVVASSNGVAGWFRLLPNAADAGFVSLTAPRIDGAIGIIDSPMDAQIYLPTTDLATGNVINLNYWWYAMPPLGD